MKRFIILITRWIALFFVLFLTGCSAYHQVTPQFPRENLRKLTSQFAPVENGYIEYYRFGKGSPIILIPGYVTDVTSWDRDFLVALEQQHEVIVLNNRNVGGSTFRAKHYESKDLANDTSHLIQELGFKKTAVLGISMGGMIAQQVAVLHPDQVSQLILINTVIAGKQAIHPNAAVEKRMLNMPVNTLGRYKIAVELFFPPAWRMRMAYALANNRFLPKDYRAINPQSVKSQQRQLVMDWIDDNATASKIRQLNLPTLILNGEADAVIPPQNSVVLASTIPHARLVRWKEGGHAMIYQFPEQIANRVNQFIAGE